MKISLNMGDRLSSSAASRTQISEAEIVAAQKGDWVAKERLAKKLLPLIESLAKKRATQASDVHDFVEAGQRGVYRALKKYKKKIGADKFSLFCLDFIQSEMNRLDKKEGGFVARLFSR
jgi:DNA-directed RNA polymerase specialized sigma subunit